MASIRLLCLVVCHNIYIQIFQTNLHLKDVLKEFLRSASFPFSTFSDSIQNSIGYKSYSLELVWS